MPSKAFVADQSPGAEAIHNNQRSEMVALALPAGKYALFASGTVEGSDRRSVHCFIETTTTTVATSGAKQKSIPCSCRSRRCSACSISPPRTRCASTAW
jgi:hypothetical protein